MNTWYAVERFSAERREALLAEVARDGRVRDARRNALDGPVGTRHAKIKSLGLAIARVLTGRRGASSAGRAAPRRGRSGTPPVGAEEAPGSPTVAAAGATVAPRDLPVVLRMRGNGRHR